MRPVDCVIGASEIGETLGLSPYRTPLQVFARKLGLDDGDDDQNETEAQRLGRHAEVMLANLFQEDFDIPLRTSATLFHPDDACLRATPDRYFRSEDAPAKLRQEWGLEDGERVVVEFKTAGLAGFLHHGRLDEDWGESWGDHVPVDYASQVQGQIGIADAAWRFFGDGWCRRGLIKPLLAGRGSPIFRVTGDPAVFDWIRKGLRLFVDKHLVPEVEPTPRNVDDWKVLERLITKSWKSKTRRNVDEGEEAAVLDWRAKKAAAEAADLALAAARDKLIRMMGHDYGWQGPWGAVLFTGGAPSSKLSTKNALADILEEAKAGPVSRARMEQIQEKHRRTYFTGRRLTPYWSDKKQTDTPPTPDTDLFKVEGFPG